MSRTRFTLAITAAIVTAITLAACSTPSGSMEGMDHGSGSASSTSSPENTGSATNTGAHTDADVAFAMGMVPHHQQAVDMADMILGKDGIDAKVITLATAIKAAQGPEITLMTGWLDAWGSPLDSMGGMHDMGSGNGMMSADDMTKLDNASGTAAAKLFLQQMIQHHEGALVMAELEIADGTNPDALKLAKSIVTSQTAELVEMKTILASL